MKNTFNSENQFWSEIALSAGFVETLAAASSTLVASDTAVLEAIKAFGVANSYWRAHHKNQFMVILRKVLEQKPAAAD